MKTPIHSFQAGAGSTPVAPGAQSFFLPGGITGIVLLHGYGGTIGDYRHFAQLLNQAGYTVIGPRLAGHGQDLATLAQSHLADWRASVDEAVQKIQHACQRVVLVGSSFGGTLALDYAERHPQVVHALVAVNPAILYRHSGLQRMLLGVLRLFTPYYPKFGLSVTDKEMYRQLGSSTAWPIAGLFETYDLIRHEVVPSLEKITAPVLLMGNENDPIVSNKGLRILTDDLPPGTTQVVTIPGRTHRPFRDTASTDFMAAQVERFLNGVAPEGKL